MAPVWAQALILGVIQGVTEFLPISSSAHLILIPQLTGWPYLGRHFDIALHLGTLLAIYSYYHQDIKQILQGTRLTRMIILASIPPACIGLILGDFFETYLNNLCSIGIFLAIFGLILGEIDKKALNKRELQDLTDLEAFYLGLAQAMALVPGVSRCGATLTVALWRGLNRSEAARISFLTALPVTAGACLLKFLKIGQPLPPELAGPSLLGIIAAAFSGRYCIKLLTQYLRTKELQCFAGYRLLLGLTLILCSL